MLPAGERNATCGGGYRAPMRTWRAHLALTLGLVAVVVNNAVYGLTGGQVSPTTPVGGRTTTSRSGSFERPMNLETLARASGAAFFARATVNHTAALVKLVERALAVPGFAMVEVVSNCHVLYGRMNDLGDASQMMISMDASTRPTNVLLSKRAGGITLSEDVKAYLARTTARDAYKRALDVCTATRDSAPD